MMRFVGIIILLFAPAMGVAQHVIVRSGEHTDFSRLAFEFSDAVEWEMGRVEDNYEIRIRGTGLRIDISEVYQRISHDRIENLTISKDNSRITLGLGCKCHADAFEFRPGLLVVDVKEGLPPETSRFEADFSSGELIESQYSDAVVVEQIPQNTPENLRENPVVDLPFRPIKEHPSSKIYEVQLGESFKVDTQAPTKDVAEMQSEILHQISRAASQGLLDASVPDTIQVTKNDHEIDQAPEHFTAFPGPIQHINIHIENSIDREFASLSERIEMTGSGSKCLPDTLFSISEWGNEESILAKISEQRGIISGEFDKADTKAVLSLAKAYIYAGFGAEALSVLSLFDLSLEEKGALVAMAQIVDAAPYEHHAIFTNQIECGADSALWAALYIPTLSKQVSINKASILGAFSGLPAHLRQLLGPKLAQKFLQIGDVNTARALRNSISRAPGDVSSEFQLIDAKLNLERGLTDSVEHALEDIIIADSIVAPRALIELLELRLQRGGEMDPQILATAESHIFEQQDTKIAAELKRLIALSFGQSGDFSKALHALYEMEKYEKLDKNALTATWEKVVENLAMNAPEAALLEFVFAAQYDLDHQNISRKIRRELALRLLEEGWPVQAEMVLKAPKSPVADDRVILARVELLVGEAENVLKRLENVAGNEAAKLRALAYEMSGNYLGAAKEYRALGDEESQKSTAWKAEDWAQLSIIGSEADRVAARLMLSRDQIGGEAATAFRGTVAHDANLLKKSESERQSIEKLLEEYPAHINENS